MDNLRPPRNTNVPKGIWVWGSSGWGKDYNIRRYFGNEMYIKLNGKWFERYQN